MKEAAADRIITAALDALSVADGEAFAELMSEDVVIATARRTRTGIDEARDWAAKRYDHLDRRYRITKLEHHEHATVVDACVEYLWRGEEAVADTSPVTFHFELAGDRIRRVDLRD